MIVSIEKSVQVVLDRDEAVKLRRVLDTAVLPSYDEEGKALAKRLAEALTKQLYFPEAR